MNRRIALLCLFTIGLLFQSCKKDTDYETDDMPVFSYTDAIVNPPDKFKLVFNTSWVGTREAVVSFQEDNVWFVEKLGDGRADVFIQNGENILSLVTNDSIAIKGDVEYRIILTTLYIGEYNIYFLAFTKTDKDYETFEPKI